MKDLDMILRSALRADPGIICKKEAIDEFAGRSEKELLDLGLERRHLKWLEKKQLAIRGYRPTPQGHELRWVLLLPASTAEPSVPAVSDSPTTTTINGINDSQR